MKTLNLIASMALIVLFSCSEITGPEQGLSPNDPAGSPASAAIAFQADLQLKSDKSNDGNGEIGHTVTFRNARLTGDISGYMDVYFTYEVSIVSGKAIDRYMGQGILELDNGQELSVNLRGNIGSRSFAGSLEGYNQAGTLVMTGKYFENLESKPNNRSVRIHGNLTSEKIVQRTHEPE